MSKRRDIFGMASVGIVPLRKEPADSAEMVSEILLGELFQIIGKQKKWWQVKALLGDYTGWINANEGYKLPDKELHEWLALNKNPQNRSPYFTFKAGNTYDQCLVTPGSVIQICGDTIQYPFGKYPITSEPEKLKGSGLLETARSFLGTPYLWGGRTDTGVDCSGFVQAVLIQHGIIFPRDSVDQSQAVPLHTTDKIEKEDVIPGDIIYFNPKSNQISHVGFYLGDGLLLHAAGKVRVQQIDISFPGRSDVSLNNTLANNIAGYQKRQELHKLKKNWKITF